ncbi:MAG: flippase-like domain-containing protein [Chloroflexi bacterium]|nr:flippase-like domain-containing protein [Chloroflexota bacterium]MYI03849.1 flippase-like domain-containing protein [Chloroflexota bacterium]
MTRRLPSWTTGSGARLALGLGGSTVFLVLFLRNADFHQVGRAFTEVSAWWIGPALVVYFAGIAARAWRWHWLLLHIERISWWRLFPIVAIGFGVNNVLPLRAGELVRAHVLYQRHGISRLTGLSSIFMTRVYDGLMLTCFLVVGVIASLIGLWGMSDAGDELTGAMSFLVFGIIGAFLVFGAIARRPDDAERMIGNLLARVPGQSHREWNWLSPLITGMSAQANRRQVSGALVASLIAWALEAVMYWMVGQAFNLGVPFPVYLLVAAAANLLITAPSTAGGVGPFEWAAKATLLIWLPTLGTVGEQGAEATAVAFAAILHGLVIIPISMVGLLFLWFFQVSARRRDLQAEP